LFAGESKKSPISLISTGFLCRTCTKDPQKISIFKLFWLGAVHLFTTNVIVAIFNFFLVQVLHINPVENPVAPVLKSSHTFYLVHRHKIFKKTNRVTK
jgi:hypothetical protein